MEDKMTGLKVVVAALTTGATMLVALATQAGPNDAIPLGCQTSFEVKDACCGAWCAKHDSNRSEADKVFDACTIAIGCPNGQYKGTGFYTCMPCK
jgi:hypothetical protein